jgi:hypothetical protein
MNSKKQYIIDNIQYINIDTEYDILKKVYFDTDKNIHSDIFMNKNTDNQVIINLNYVSDEIIIKIYNIIKFNL